MVARYGRGRASSHDLALRVYTTRAARRRSPARAPRRGVTLPSRRVRPISWGREVDVLCVKGSGRRPWRTHRARRPAGGCGLRSCGSWAGRARRWSDEDMVRPAARPISSIRWGAQSPRSRPCCTHSCRTSLSIIPIPRRSSAADRPTGRPKGARSRGFMTAAWALCPISCRASRSRRRAAAILRKPTRPAHGLILHKHGISSPSATGRAGSL